MPRSLLIAIMLTAAMLPLGSCRTLYYDTMEAFGQHKRDLLVSRVTDARDEQQEAKEQFRDALEQFTALVDTPRSELRDVYDRLTSELDDSESQAEAVRDKVDSVERVSQDLFAEWRRELEQYQNDDLRRQSEDTLRRTEMQYDQLITAMKRPIPRMDAVLSTFRDQVLFLKHNLNAQVIASLQGTVDAIEFDTARLIEEMEAAIAEADAFIGSMESTL